MVYLLFRQLCVLFLVMAAGFAIVRVHFFQSADSIVLSRLIVYLILPCVIFKGFQVEYDPQIRNNFLLALLAAAILHAFLFILTGLLNKCFSLSRVERGSLIYSSAGNMIVPLVTAMLGEEWVIYTSAFLFVQTILLWTHGESLLTGKAVVGWKKILTNCNLCAAIIGIGMFLLRFRLTGIPMDAVSMVAGMIGPTSMLVLGMVLAEIKWRDIFFTRRIYVIVLLKMLGLPFAVLLFLKYGWLSSLTPDGRTVLLVSLMAVITPCASAIVQIAQIHDTDVQSATAINVLTNLVCIATMPLMTYIYLR